MKRSQTGRTVTTETLGEKVHAFIPEPLPPMPPLQMGGEIDARHSMALLALGRLDSVSTLLPDASLFLYGHVRKEAVLSSQIEGTKSSLSDLLLFELNSAPGVPQDDVVEVSNYVGALEHGLARARGGVPLSGRLICELHAKLLSRGRGAGKLPGEYRRSQVWIGGSRPGNAHFVPPPHTEVAECMASLERFMHDQPAAMSPLIKAALTHAQFETIHPFLDGNGRVGRLLIVIQLCLGGMLQEPLLYPSLYFKRHRREYYRWLDSVRSDGDWEGWLAYFFEAVTETAEDAFRTVTTLSAVLKEDREIIARIGKGGPSARLIHTELERRPLVTARGLAKSTGLSDPTVGAALRRLEALSIVREITGRQRDRVFAYDRYIKLLSAGTESAPG